MHWIFIGGHGGYHGAAACVWFDTNTSKKI
jgi:hypothetical protein